MEPEPRILRQREEAGISTRALASQIGANPAYLSRVERGPVPPSGDLVDGAAKAFECNAADPSVLDGRAAPCWREEAIAESPEETAGSMGAALAGSVAQSQTAYGR